MPLSLHLYSKRYAKASFLFSLRLRKKGVNSVPNQTGGAPLPPLTIVLTLFTEAVSWLLYGYTAALVPLPQTSKHCLFVILATAEIKAKRKSVCDGRTREGPAGSYVCCFRCMWEDCREKQWIYCKWARDALLSKLSIPQSCLRFQKAVFDEKERFH